MKVTLTQWNKIGDHPLVTLKCSAEFEYQEAKKDGAGFIESFTIVYPGQYIVEINGIYIGVISARKAKQIKHPK
ncbi:MAG: hypothetical protein H7263_06535 [Candidatus Sericytochromatia bacterium]|nr:hypothetical protein [Candidatus Sericytochromatia bacterium]